MRPCTRLRGVSALPLAAIVALATAGGGTMILAPVASAYTHAWACYSEAHQKCYDNTGKTYNHWHLVSIKGEVVVDYCAKGETSSGGVIQFSCVNNSFGASGVVCTSTETHAYGYSSFGPQGLEGFANTEGGC
jgi:hypothetical protein